MFRPGRYKSNLYRSGCLVFLLPLLLIAGCINPNSTTEPTSYDSKAVSELVYMFHDDTYNVRCWVYHAGYQGGISCIPDTQLDTK